MPLNHPHNKIPPRGGSMPPSLSSVQQKRIRSPQLRPKIPQIGPEEAPNFHPVKPTNSYTISKPNKTNSLYRQKLASTPQIVIPKKRTMEEDDSMDESIRRMAERPRKTQQKRAKSTR